MIGSLCFAYLYSDVFEVNIKEWRLFADLLNNVGLTLDLLISLYPEYYLVFTALSAFSKACCGVCAGATKGRISAHFAVRDHLSDVIAKESTQETAVALTGMLVGSICVKFIGTDTLSNWAVFVTLLCVHVWANYNLVRVLILDTINPQRSFLLTDAILRATEGLKDENEVGIADMVRQQLTPQSIARRESIFRPLWLAVNGPQHGGSVSSLLTALDVLSSSSTVAVGNRASTTTPISPATWKGLRECWAGQPFVIGFDVFGRVVVCLEEGSDDCAADRAFFIACYIHHTMRGSGSGEGELGTFDGRPSTMFIETAVGLSRDVFNGIFFLSPPLSSITHISKTELRRKYERLFQGGANEALTWFESFRVAQISSSTVARKEQSTSATVSNERPSDVIETMADSQIHSKASKGSTTVHSVFDALTAAGWDVTAGRSRLGAGPWRYVTSMKEKTL
jgi:hypothetical protein